MGTNLMKISIISILNGIYKCSSPRADCWKSRGQWKNVFKKHASDYDQLLEISHWEPLSQIKSVLERPMGATLKLESKKVVTAGSTLKVFTKLLDQLRGIGRIGDDGVLLFGYIFMAYLDIGGEH